MLFCMDVRAMPVLCGWPAGKALHLSGDFEGFPEILEYPSCTGRRMRAYFILRYTYFPNTSIASTKMMRMIAVTIMTPVLKLW